MDFNLTEKLYSIKETGKYPLHMPGHKRSEKMQKYGNELSLPYDFDITEIDGYDNLHAPEGILLKLGENAAKLYGAKYAYPLVNGSTSGILAAIGACVKRGDKIILSRASHKSVYSAIELYSLDPTYIYPAICSDTGILGSVTVRDIEDAFEKSPEASVVVITSPTYEGVISDIESIADAVHSRGAYLVLDCAHGAHLGFCENGYFPSSMMQYADIAIVSLHKTLPALTQTALCLNFSANAHELDIRIRKNLSIFMSSSPSYILLSSIDKCLSIVANHKEELFSDYTDILESFEDRIADLEHLFVLGYGKSVTEKEIFALDKGKITVFCKDLVDLAGNRVTASVLAKFLRLNGFEPEMVSRDYLILMTSVMDDRDAILKVAELLCNFDAWCVSAPSKKEHLSYPEPTAKLSLTEAADCDFELVELKDAKGRISLDYVTCYPPGIPVLCPGEEITPAVIEFVEESIASSINVIGADKIKIKR